jgi:CubicO group peptidase (beta-lactamase class C family)
MCFKKQQLFLCLLLLVTTLLQGQDNLPKFISQDLDTYIQKGMSDWQIPGLAVAIVKDGKVIHQKGYGVLEQGKPAKVDENTTFMIGSNTKAFTATALAMLQEEGKLNLNDKASYRLPGFTLQNPYAHAEVTISDLLSHQIGFETFQGDFIYWQSNLTTADVIETMGKIRAPYNFRTKWGYCNACYVAAGEMIPHANQKSWAETIQEKILTPLQMNRTLMLCKDLENASNNATAHTLVDGKLQTIPSHHLPNQSIDNLAPAGSMSSSASDMAKWLQAQLSMGKVEGQEVLSAKALQQTRTARSILGVDDRAKQNSHFYLYGLGLMINDRAGRVVYSHTGGIDGFLSSVLFIPEEQLGVVIMTNTDQNDFFQVLGEQIQDAFLGIQFENYHEKANTKQKRAKEKEQIDAAKAVVKEGHKPTVPLDAFAGKYAHPIYGQIELKKQGDKLKIYFSRHDNLTVELSHMKDNNFLGVYSNPVFGTEEFQFKVRGDEVGGLVLRVADFVEMTEYEFEKVR